MGTVFKVINQDFTTIGLGKIVILIDISSYNEYVDESC